MKPRKISAVDALLTVALTLLWMSFTCIARCNNSFSSRGGLNRHHNQCAIFQTSQALKLEQRRVVAAQCKEGSAHGRLRARKARISNLTAKISDNLGSENADLDPNITSIQSIPALAPDPSMDAVSDVLPKRRSRAGRLLTGSRVPRKFRDTPPQAPVHVMPAPPPIPNLIRRVILHVRDSFRTGVNQFGVLREYLHRPSYDPDIFLKPEDLANFTTEPPSIPVERPARTFDPPWPFENMSKYLLMTWHNTGSSQKTERELTRLAKEVLGVPDFKPEDLGSFDAHRENKRLDNAFTAEEISAPFSDDGWREVTVDIEVPVPIANTPPRKFAIPGLHHRSIIQVIKETWGSATSSQFHFTPFRRIHLNPDTQEETRIFDEVYTSEAFEVAHNKLQNQDPEPGCKLERVVAGLMFWSDSTTLTSFSTAKVWPIYMYFANLSKYTRAKPNSGACHHIAYIPSIPDRLREFLSDFISSNNQVSVLFKHCRRELMQEVWRLLLDDEFVAAYQHGVVVKCADGVFRRVYPRIFTYSADYPEKVLLATIRNQGLCACPRCSVPLAEFDRLGWVKDSQKRLITERSAPTSIVANARNQIYNKGCNVDNAGIERMLKPQSLVPTINVFTEKLGSFGFNPYPTFVVDLMHEFELGIWKTTFIHIIGVLYAAVPGGRAVTMLNERFRQIPMFGRGTIRRFSDNISEMKKQTARGFEDILQCMIPAVDGLLAEPYNTHLLTLLYRLSEWHALAKLRMHTEHTLVQLENATVVLGQQLRSFRDWSQTAFTVRELPKQKDARDRRKQKRKALSTQSAEQTTSKKKKSKPRVEVLNLLTYKLHALGDYVRTIRLFGTTDSYSTQIGELAHRLVKKFYRRTNKINATRQIARLERRETRLRRAREAATAPRKRHAHHVQFSDNDPLPYTGIEQHHHISDSKSFPHQLLNFVNDPPNDPAKMDFIPKLKGHLLGRLLHNDFDGDEIKYSDEERNTVRIINNQIYSAKVLRVNYTTYDMRRDQDSMNPRTHCDVMVISPESGEGAHPFWYARVLGVFHAKVLHIGHAAQNRSIQHIEFLWVRWFGVEPDYRSGSRVSRLPKIGFIPDTDEGAFGFLDPSLVLRGCQLIPAFAGGRTLHYLQTSSLTAARHPEETDDWANYYVIIWVDRDMFIRYFGGGIGHMTEGSRWQSADEIDVGDVESEELGASGNLQDNSVNGILHSSELGNGGTKDDSADTDSGEGSDDFDSDHSSDNDLESESDLGAEDGEDMMDVDNRYSCL